MTTTEKTAQQTNEADRQNAVETIQRGLRGAEVTLKQFAQRFAEDPHYAFDWSQPALEAAATKKVYGRALALLEAQYAVAVLVDELTDAVLRGAKYGERSTSPVGNELARCVLAAQATLLDELT